MSDTTTRQARLRIKGRRDGGDYVYVMCHDDDPTGGIEICRMPFGLLMTSGQRNKLTDLLASMVTASFAEMIESKGGTLSEVRFTDTDKPQ